LKKLKIKKKEKFSGIVRSSVVVSKIFSSLLPSQYPDALLPDSAFGLALLGKKTRFKNSPETREVILLWTGGKTKLCFPRASQQVVVCDWARGLSLILLVFFKFTKDCHFSGNKTIKRIIVLR
jgi:hypothetical protein